MWLLQKKFFLDFFVKTSTINLILESMFCHFVFIKNRLSNWSKSKGNENCRSETQKVSKPHWNITIYQSHSFSNIINSFCIYLSKHNYSPFYKIIFRMSASMNPIRIDVIKYWLFIFCLLFFNYFHPMLSVTDPRKKKQ